MPTISFFYGIIVQMFSFDDNPHHRPHIHVKYQGHKAAFAIDESILLVGDFPDKQRKLVEAWIELHKDELLADWELAVSGEEIFKIEPLR